MRARIKKAKRLKDIPSASGIEIFENRIFIIGDDTLYLFEIDHEGTILNKTPLADQISEGRIPKSKKPDFEAMSLIYINNEAYFLIVGSGSLSPQRDKGILIRISDHHLEQLELGKFYQLLKSKLNQKDQLAFNIEGLCTLDDELIFAQRGGITGNQFLFRVPMDDFLRFCKEENSDLRVNSFQFKLPKESGVPYGISGCTITEDKKQLLFCASAEQTENTYDDGEIKGSLLGLIDLQSDNDLKLSYCKIENHIGQDLFKMESIAILDENEKGKFDLLGVCDNDDGTSLLLEIELSTND